MAILSDLSKPLQRGERIKCVCDICGCDFELLGKYRKKILNPALGVKGKFCSKKCMGLSNLASLEVPCDECSVIFKKLPCQIRKTKHNFCNRSCGAKYRNKHKNTGNRRSKLEVWLESKLTTLYPNLKFLFNDTSSIQSELDICIPELNIAFELNGIFHYEKIFKNFERTQERDKIKVSLCANAGIGLCVIDTSKQKYFKESSSQEFLTIITNIIEERISEKLLFKV